MQPLKYFLQDINIAIQRWYLGQFSDNEILGQSHICIVGQETVNNEMEKHESESGGNDEEVDKEWEEAGLTGQNE